jgi:phosphoglycolate phosphatase-like HAD superfamily hydrolase
MIAVIDVDGTLVDTNYHHAVAWFRAFRRVGVTVPVWRVHRAIGMGGDRLVAEVAGDEVERAHGDEVRALWAECFAPMLPEITPLEGARELLAAFRARGDAVVLASSGKPEHVDHYLDLLDARPIIDGWTTAADVDATKPATDLLEVALDRTEAGAEDGAEVVTIGDSVWDCQAARRLGVPSVGLRTGGFGTDELTDAGAAEVYDDLTELRANLATLPTASPPAGPGVR